MTTNDGGRTVYAVSSGSYSDYSVGVMFTTEEVANQYLELEKARNSNGWYHDGSFIEEFYLFDTLPEEVEVRIPRQDGTEHTYRELKIAQDQASEEKARQEGIA